MALRDPDLMLLSPDRERGGKRGVTHTTCTPLSQPLALSGERNVSAR